MPIHKASFLNRIKSGIKGAGEAASNFNKARKTDKQTDKMQSKLFTARTKKRFIKEHGIHNYNKSKEPGAIFNKYKNMYDNMEEEEKKKGLYNK